MATAAERTSIIQLVVGMVNAAPGADILAELEDIIDSGLTIEELAVAISENPAFSGDTGLFPDFLPNAIFAENFLTALLGDEVTAEVLTATVDEMTADLNAGTSRGAAMNAAIDSLAASTDPDFADAAAALANKTEVAEYYSVDVAQSSADLDDLIAVVSAVTSDADAVTDGTAAVDTEIAANQDLSDLVANKTAAETALAAGEAAADGDGDDDTSITSAQVQGVIDTLDAGDLDAAVAGYDAATEAVKAALVSDQQVADATALVGFNTILTTATTAVAGITGLASAIAVFQSAVLAKAAADEAAALTDVARTAAEGDFDVLATPLVATDTGGGTYTDGTDPMIIVSGLTLVLAAGVTEVSHPGSTALLAAVLTDLGAQAVAGAADTAVEDALDQVENLDAQTATQDASLAAVGTNMDANVGNLIDPADVDAPTLAEIDAQQTALDAGIAQLQADLAAFTTTGVAGTDESGLQAIIDAAVTNGFIAELAGSLITDLTADITGNGDGTQGGVDTIVTALLAELIAGTTAVPGSGNLALDFADLVATYEADGDGTQTIAAGTAPVADAFLVAEAAVAGQETAISDLATDLATRATLLASIDSLGDLEDAVTDVDAAFGDAGFGVPTTLDSAVKAATVDDDVFLVGGIDSQVISFGGDDVLFVGADLTLNADATAGDEGDNTVLEVWITGTTNAVITIETSVFGSDAASPETYQITLTGVSASDLVLADGFVSLAS